MLWQALQQAAHQMTGFVGKPGGARVLNHMNLLLKRFASAAGQEGCDTTQEFVEEHPQAPEVHLLAMAFAEQDLGRHVLMAPAGGFAPPRLRLAELLGAPAEVADLRTETCQQNVLWLQVSVCTSLPMDVLNTIHDLLEEGCSQGLLQAL